MVTFLSISLFVHLIALLLSPSLTWIILLLISTFVNLFLVLLCVTAEFFAISFLMIYVGAIAILLVFALMVVRSDVSLPKATFNFFEVFLFFLVGKLVYLCCQQVDARFNYEILNSYLSPLLSNSKVGFTTLLEVSNDINVFGLYLYNTYVDLFLFSGVILAIAIIAVIKLLIPESELADNNSSPKF